LTVLSSLRTELGTVGDQVIDNPVGVAAVENPEENTVGPALILLLGVLAAAFGSLALRFRRSRGEQRQQLKWFTHAAALVPLAVLDEFLPGWLRGLPHPPTATTKRLTVGCPRGPRRAGDAVGPATAAPLRGAWRRAPCSGAVAPANPALAAALSGLA
jgi:hypothetical protein